MERLSNYCGKCYSLIVFGICKCPKPTVQEISLSVEQEDYFFLDGSVKDKPNNIIENAHPEFNKKSEDLFTVKS